MTMPARHAQIQFWVRCWYTRVSTTSPRAAATTVRTNALKPGRPWASPMAAITTGNAMHKPR